MSMCLEAIGRTIETIYLEEQKLSLNFTDGSLLTFVDNGQSCCEERYMRTDDVLSEFFGSKFLSVAVKEAPPIAGDDGEEHEVQFLEVMTDRGAFTISNHNEHNGYYGGFDIVCQFFKEKES